VTRERDLPWHSLSWAGTVAFPATGLTYALTGAAEGHGNRSAAGPENVAIVTSNTVYNQRRWPLSLRQIAAKLTEDGINTAGGGRWTATAVKNLIDLMT
jgi:hypothetical protein